MEINGSVIVVSQFTLYADTKKGNRPGFSTAARPEQAEPLYEELVYKLRAVMGAERVGSGVFGAHMKVRLLNEGPVTIELRVES
jgi:D-tyrosyl-tRNA(Tyr) deacylase